MLIQLYTGNLLVIALIDKPDDIQLISVCTAY